MSESLDPGYEEYVESQRDLEEMLRRIKNGETIRGTTAFGGTVDRDQRPVIEGRHVGSRNNNSRIKHQFPDIPEED